MMLNRNGAAAVLLVLGCSLASAAQTVYRCGNEYSQSPCPTGKAIDVDDSRTDEQRAAAREVAAREKALGREMTHDRRVAEADARPPKAQKVKHRPTAAVAPLVKAPPKKRAKHPEKDEKDFVSIVPKERSAKK